MRFIKIKFLFVMLFSMVIASAQNIEDKNKIQKNYDLEKINRLIERLKEKEAQKQAKIDAFLSKNPTVKKTYLSYGRQHVLYEIINNKPVYISSDNQRCAIATKTNSMNPGGSLGLNLEGENDSSAKFSLDERNAKEGSALKVVVKSIGNNTWVIQSVTPVKLRKKKKGMVRTMGY